MDKEKSIKESVLADGKYGKYCYSRLILYIYSKLLIMKKQRQYRSNQGRDPKKNEQCYKTIELAVIVFTIAVIVSLIIQQ